MANSRIDSLVKDLEEPPSGSANSGRTGQALPAGSRLPRALLAPHARNRLILVAVAGLVLWWLLVQSWDAMGPFVLALVLGYLMMPLVDLLARFLPRAISILVVYTALIGTVWAAVAWLSPIVAGQIAQLSGQVPAYSTQIEHWFADAGEWYNSLPLSTELRQSIESAVRNSLGAIGSTIQQGALGALGIITRAMGFVVGLLIIPFWLFYVLKDKSRCVAAFNRMLPVSWRPDVWNIVHIVDRAIGRYIRGQLILALVVGLATGIGMAIVGAPYALLLGIISGLTEVIPIIGPIVGAVPGLLVAAVSGDWFLVLKVLAVYILVQQLENNLLVPKIQGASVKMHPAIVMVALVVGSQVAGLLGMVVAVPVAAALRDVYLYLYRRFAEDPGPVPGQAVAPSHQIGDTSIDEHGGTQEQEEANLAEVLASAATASEVQNKEDSDKVALV